LLNLNRKKKKEDDKTMSIPTIKDKYRYRIIGRPNQVDFAVLDMKNAQRVSKYLSRDKAEEKARELTNLAISEEKKRRREIRLGYS